jgi:uncharacterized protein YjlB
MPKTQLKSARLGNTELEITRIGFVAWALGGGGWSNFHSTAHEVLGTAAGRANVVLGGPHGRRFELVAVLPAGTGHCNVGSDAHLLVVGAYPNGMRWDIRRGDPEGRDEVLANIARVPLPEQDPVQGKHGPLLELWRRAAGRVGGVAAGNGGAVSVIETPLPVPPRPEPEPPWPEPPEPDPTPGPDFTVGRTGAPVLAIDPLDEHRSPRARVCESVGRVATT